MDGKALYTAHREAARAFTGQELPEWSALSDSQQHYWELEAMEQYERENTEVEVG